MNITPVAYIHTDFPEKFGIPRQSGLAGSLTGMLVFEPEYRNPDMLRGLEGFSHLWLIWEFSANKTSKWQPTVRPPRLGGNEHMGVFATRSPFRPNPLGLSCVEIDGIELDTPDGPVIRLKGADLMDGTPVYDIKPYIRYADSHPEAVCGYVDELQDERLKVIMPEEVASAFSDQDMVEALVEVLSLDPRPSYHDDPLREYGMSFGGFNVRFKVMGDTLTIVSVDKL
jgi:tRNA-Thr(GGU) m(6)t(6)A37 methyltransferase TsaA